MLLVPELLGLGPVTYALVALASTELFSCAAVLV
jgi:hypothetical protein